MRQTRDVLAVEADRARRSARAGAAAACRRSTCRSRIRRRGTASRPGSIAKQTPSTALTSATVARASSPRFDREMLLQALDLDDRRHAATAVACKHALGLVAGDDMSARRWRAARAPRRGSARPRSAQRGAKAQPSIGSRSDGTMPGISARRRLRSLRAQARDRGHQAARVGMRRAVEQLGGRRLPRPCGRHT